MKSTKIVTRAGTFKIILAVKGPRGATQQERANALDVALHRLKRAERRFTILRNRRKEAAPRRAKAGKR